MSINPTPSVDLAVYQEWQIPLPGSDSEICVRVYSGRYAARMPGLLFLHGGYFNSGKVQDADEICQSLMEAAVVISIDYPIAPKAVFPQAIEAVYVVLEWVADHARQLNINPLRLFIGGHQAGGNMAVAVAMMARDRLFDRTRKRKLLGQFLISPMLDPMLTCHSPHEMNKFSFKQGWHDYLSKSNDFQHPYAAPLWSRRLLSLPKALLITDDTGPFHGETSQFAKKLCSAGIKVQLNETKAGSPPRREIVVNTGLISHVLLIRAFLNGS